MPFTEIYCVLLVTSTRGTVMCTLVAKITFSTLNISRVWLPNLRHDFELSPFAPASLVSRVKFGGPILLRHLAHSPHPGRIFCPCLLLHHSSFPLSNMLICGLQVVQLLVVVVCGWDNCCCTSHMKRVNLQRYAKN